GIFALKPSISFKELVLNRGSAWLVSTLQLPTNVDNVRLVRPLLDDILVSESFFAMGGKPQNPLSCVLAIQLDDARAKVWQDNLRNAFGSPGASFKAEDFSGEQWSRKVGSSFWTMRAGNWLLVGEGADLMALRNQYLQNISQHNSPGP